MGGGARAGDLVLGLVVSNGLVFAALGPRGQQARPLRWTGPAGHLLNCGLIATFYWVNPIAANLFYGSAMLLAAARGYGACEMFAVWNWARRRDDQLGCPILLPVDIVDARIWERPPAC